MAYTYEYKLMSAPSPRTDGSGMVDHDIEMFSSENGGATWTLVPGRHKTVSIPANDMLTNFNSADPNWLKATNYVYQINGNINTVPVPNSSWETDLVTVMLDANKASNSAATQANTFITVTFQLTYPADLPIVEL